MRAPAQPMAQKRAGLAAREPVKRRRRSHDGDGDDGEEAEQAGEAHIEAGLEEEVVGVHDVGVGLPVGHGRVGLLRAGFEAGEAHAGERVVGDAVQGAAPDDEASGDVAVGGDAAEEGGLLRPVGRGFRR